MDMPLEILVRYEIMDAPSRQYCAPEKKQTAAALVLQVFVLTL
jgi:hypothetical protein